jgi:hypothetical protein
MINVERLEAKECRLAKLFDRHAAVEVGVGRNDWFRKGEEAEALSALKAIVTSSAAPAPAAASTSASTMTAASATVTTATATVTAALAAAAAAIVRAGHHHEPGASAGSNLRSDDIFVMRGFVGIDFPVVIGVEQSEEPIGVQLHFIGRDLTVVIAVGLGEPGGKHVLATALGAKRLAHRADEDAAEMVRSADWRRGPRGRWGRLGDDGSQRKNQRKRHWQTSLVEQYLPAT